MDLVAVMLQITGFDYRSVFVGCVVRFNFRIDPMPVVIVLRKYAQFAHQGFSPESGIIQPLNEGCLATISSPFLLMVRILSLGMVS